MLYVNPTSRGNPSSVDLRCASSSPCQWCQVWELLLSLFSGFILCPCFLACLITVSLFHASHTRPPSVYAHSFTRYILVECMVCTFPSMFPAHSARGPFQCVWSAFCRQHSRCRLAVPPPPESWTFLFDMHEAVTGQVLRLPLFQLPQLISQWVNARVAVQRLQEFLSAHEEPPLPQLPPAPQGQPQPRPFLSLFVESL